jgi:2-polyprenyl-6-methoxyphenol hydroxylase-like FAD-dependent oxidoreductase
VTTGREVSADHEVLVVGAGPVGLAAAIELGMRGVRVLLVERNARGGAAPRAKTTNVRTRTHLRRWGIAGRLAAASPLGIDYPNDVIFVTRLSGHRLAHFKDAFNAAPIRSPLYPEHGQWIPQYTLEKVLLEHARSLPSVDVVFDTTLLSAKQTADQVVAVLRTSSGQERTVRVHYLIGADGARSTVRDLIGARMDGRHGLSRNYNVVFRAPDLHRSHPHPPAVMYWQSNADGGSLIGPMDREHVWFFMPTALKENERLTSAEAASAIARSTGIDARYDILSTDEWFASELLADRYRRGCLFLAGDACHLHPPFGGYGMNMGVGDGVDLGWKLAAVLQGWGGPALLESYEAERRPLHRTVIDEAVANHAVLGKELWREGLEDDTPHAEQIRREVGEAILALKAREFHSLGMVLGLRYDSSPIVAAETTSRTAAPDRVYVPDPQPGSLAPHAWLPDGRSLYDLFGKGFTLLVAEDADESELLSAEVDARDLAIPLEVVRPSGVPVRRLYDASYTLIRPDQFIAWRGGAWSKRALRHAAGWGVSDNTGEMS